ncbi:hypothetical protein [Actinoalloteichus caeruleus]|uniref:hypothetical protein n=1 Tax=Actinoalloteichus cyanogriseus TaxID=2893586 RepID=UPI0004AA57E2|nr:hypothetical protein [Actinoalloteichus caeruleus]
MREQHDQELTTRLARQGGSPAEDGEPAERRGAFGLSGAQITAGALAAVTSAVLGSQLGVAGTVAGAAVASVVSTVGGAVYQRYLERTAETVRATAARAPLGRRRQRTAGRAVGDGRTGPVASPSHPVGPRSATEPTTRLTVPHPSPGAPTARLAGPPPRDAGPPDTPIRGEASARPPDTELLGQGVGGHRDADSTALLPTSAGTNRLPTDGPGEKPPRRRRPTRMIVAGGVLSFLLAMAAIVGVELVRGESLSGGSTGTSISGILGGEPLFRRDDVPPPAEQDPPAGGADVVDPPNPAPPAGTGTTGAPEVPTTSGEEPGREPAGNEPSETEPPPTTTEAPAEDEPEGAGEQEDDQEPAPGARLEIPGRVPAT